MTKCMICGKPITRSGQKTCSRACEGKRRNKHVTLRCRICGKAFEVSWPRRKSAKFCSVSCRNKADRKVKNRPDRAQLKFLIQRLTLKQIAKQYNVTETAIICWLHDVGLERPTRAERNALKRSARALGRSV